MRDLDAKRELATTAQAMLEGDLSYLEGAVRVLQLRQRISDISPQDSDIEAFEVISSETDSLPFESDKVLWSSEALSKLVPDLNRAEKWAESVARKACENLVARYGRS